MKVLQINAVNGIRSTGRTCFEMEKELEKNGIESYIVATNEYPNSKNNYIMGNLIDWKIHALFSRVFGLQGYYSKSSTKKLLDYIQKVNPSIIHLRNLHSNYINLRILLTYIKEKNIPLVVTLHDCWFYTGKCTYPIKVKCEKWKKICKECPQLKNDNVSWFFDRTSKMYLEKKELFSKIKNKAVIGVSDWVTNEAKQSFLGESKILKTIYNWIDFDVFYPRDLEEVNKFKDNNELNNKFIILGVATFWSSWKGIDKFLELSKSLKENQIILLVGEIDPSIQLPNNIKSLGAINDTNQLAIIYSSSDIFLNMSLNETFGKVSAESISCGTPVITSNTTANPEIVGEDCGIVLNDYTNNNILLAIKEISLKGKEFYRKNTISRSRENFNKANQVEKYIEIYEELCNTVNG